MGRLDWRMLLCAALIASHFQDAEQIFIKKQTVPPFVVSGEDHIILDCDYDLEKTPIDLLYVKWYHNEYGMVYQWLYNGEPQALPPVDKYIDLSYNASQIPTTMYRAMKLVKPGVDLSGEYTCTVSAMDDEDSETKRMIVYSTAKPRLSHKKTTVDGVDGVELTCVAEGLYPRPTLDVSVDNVPVERKPVITQGTDKKYNITTRVELRDDHVPDPSTVVCVLGIPDANFSVSTDAIYYPGPSTTTTTTTSTTLQRKMGIQALDNSQRDTDNGGGNGGSSISNGLILLLVSIVAGSAYRF